MTPQTYTDETRSRLGPAVSAAVTDAVLSAAFRATLSRVLRDVPASRLTATGPLVVYSTLSPITEANWSTAIWLDDVYGPAMVEGMLSFLFGQDSDDTFDLSRSQMHEKAFRAMLAPGGG